MRERAEALGGFMRVISAPQKGTTVEVNIPFKDVKL
jgi:signal transduction histidine kinase